MQECMNCGGPVADDDTHCTTCGLERGKVIWGERPWDDEAREPEVRFCALCGDPLLPNETDVHCDNCNDDML